MANLSTADARALAQSYQDMSGELARQRLASWSSIPLEEHAVIDTRIWSLLCAASDLVTEATTLDIQALEHAGGRAALLKATQSALEAMKDAAIIHSALAIAVTAIDLAAAITRGDIGEIANFIEHLAGQSSAPPAAPETPPAAPSEGG